MCLFSRRRKIVRGHFYLFFDLVVGEFIIGDSVLIVTLGELAIAIYEAYQRTLLPIRWSTEALDGQPPVSKCQQTMGGWSAL